MFYMCSQRSRAESNAVAIKPRFPAAALINLLRTLKLLHGLIRRLRRSDTRQAEVAGGVLTCALVFFFCSVISLRGRAGISGVLSPVKPRVSGPSQRQLPPAARWLFMKTRLCRRWPRRGQRPEALYGDCKQTRHAQDTQTQQSPPRHAPMTMPNSGS